MASNRLNFLRNQKKSNRKNFAFKENSSKGQALVILAVSFLAILAFVGFATDAGSLYITYTQLKRAIDASAVAAANNIKVHVLGETAAQRKTKIVEAAREMLNLNHVEDVSSLEVYLCDDTVKPTEFAGICPNLAAGEAARKLAWVQATQDAPVYFLRLFGIQNVPLTVTSIGEAATVDMVLVFDVSESMASDTDCGSDHSCTPNYEPTKFNPSQCNANNNCYPLRQAKDAAKGLIRGLFDGYDQVAVVTFDYKADVRFPLSSDLSAAQSAIDSQVNVHDDAPYGLIDWTFYPGKKFNPIFPDDRDGNGVDADPGDPCTLYGDGTPWEKPDPFDPNTWKPCDDDSILDAFDWNDNHNWTDDNLPSKDPFVVGSYEVTSLLSTCTGCGIRVGTQVLKNGGRPASVWIMVLLSDGIANLSDTHNTSAAVPSSFIYGFCGSQPGTSFWSSCIDYNTPGFSAGRYCIDSPASQCPPGSTHTNTSGPYSVEDYAMDMTDAAGLLESTNTREPKGEDIVIYSIGLGAASSGANLLRYVADIGDNGMRDWGTSADPCYNAGSHTFLPSTSNCGNYYYAPTGAYLDQIFEHIAAQIFTKISR
jgi:Putative Flp pilus-assembly TadE/G-like